MSYVYWRRQPRRHALISVDERGLRTTVPAGSPGGPKIFMFGGSTMWGTGARDEFTIPSILARELARRGVAATVTNYGETGWVTTQELIALEIELREGRRPDLVIFYDGINDTYTAFQQGVAGIPQNEANRVREFNFMKKPVRERLRLIARDAALRLAVRRLLGAFTAADDKGLVVQLDEAAPGASLDVEQSTRLARQVIDAYWSNVELVRALGEHYKFKSLFYWQPTVSDKPSLTAYEQECRAEMKPIDRFYQQTYAALRDRQLGQPGAPWIQDLTSIFSTVSEPVFVDRFHLGEPGNEMIARQMLPDVLAELDAATKPGAAAAAVR
jgi:lysophospholipase L1-like esterase